LLILSEVDAIFDRIEPLLLSLASEHELAGESVERWRWDEPSITLKWQDGLLGKSLVFITEDEPNNSFIEVNAWNGLLGSARRWRHSTWKIPDGVLTTSDVHESVIRSLLEKGFAVVNSWQEQDLV
jgi:hypothetical protein